jgi:cytochrome c5
MRADTARVARGIVAIAIASGLFGAGCRSAKVGGNVDSTLKTTLASSETAEIAALPEGQGKALVTDRCLLCHGAGLITQQRKDATAWGRTVTQMRTWGTQMQDEEQTALVAYLSEHFGSGAARR